MNRARAYAICALVVGAGIALMSYLPVWLDYFHSADGLPAVHSTFTGRQLVPLSGALGLVLLAGAVAVWILPRGWARLAGVVLLGASLIMTFQALGFRLSPELSLAAALSRDSKASSVVVVPSAISVNAWWLAAMVGSVIAVLGSLLAAFHLGSWTGMSARYDRRAASAAAQPQTASGAAAWDALDRGDDPTQ